MDDFQQYPPGLLSALGINPEDLRRQQQQAGLLSAGLQLLAGSGYSPVRQPLGQLLGQAGMAGVQGMQQAGNTAIDRALRGMQVQEFTKRQQERDRLAQATQQFRERLSGLAGGTVTPSMAIARGGPTQAAAETIGQPLSPTDIAKQQQIAAMEFAAEVSPQALAASMLSPKEPKESFRVLTDAEKTSLNLPKEMAFQVSSTGKVLPISQGPLVQNFVGGEKGFKNELDLKSAFKSEPIYKGYQEMRSAYGQVTESLKKGTPAGDLAGATKFMKLLDPGSVVRESELYLAMSATGALDRFTNYANSVIKGTKLTPAQRTDFQSLADKLFADSANMYNSKYNEYEQLGNRYGFNAKGALGERATLPSQQQVQTGSLVDQAREEMKKRGLR